MNCFITILTVIYPEVRETVWMVDDSFDQRSVCSSNFPTWKIKYNGPEQASLPFGFQKQQRTTGCHPCERAHTTMCPIPIQCMPLSPKSIATNQGNDPCVIHLQPAYCKTQNELWNGLILRTHWKWKYTLILCWNDHFAHCPSTWTLFATTTFCVLQ